MVGGNVALSKEETCEGERPAMWRPGDVSPAEGMACAEALRWSVLSAQGAPGAMRERGPWRPWWRHQKDPGRFRALWLL